MTEYYINDFKTKLIKSVDSSVFVYNFIEQKWEKDYDYWFNEINFECAVNCLKITEETAKKIIRGEKYDVN